MSSTTIAGTVALLAAPIIVIAGTLTAFEPLSIVGDMGLALPG